MNLDDIDQAIHLHLAWIADFKAALAGTGKEAFDFEKARNDSACALGHWLATPETLALLGRGFHARIVAVHGTFHEIASEVVASLQAGDKTQATHALVAGCEDLSNNLAEFLKFAKKSLPRGVSDPAD